MKKTLALEAVRSAKRMLCSCYGQYHFSVQKSCDNASERTGCENPNLYGWIMLSAEITTGKWKKINTKIG